MHVRSGRQKPHAGGRTPVTVWTPGSIGHVVREHSSLVTERTLIPNRYTTFVLVPPVTAGPWPLHVTEKVTFWPRTAGSGDMVTFVTGQSALEDEQQKQREAESLVRLQANARGRLGRRKSVAIRADQQREQGGVRSARCHVGHLGVEKSDGVPGLAQRAVEEEEGAERGAGR